MEPADFVKRMDSLSAGYQRSFILFAALRAHLFEYLRTCQDTEAIARRTGWHPRGVRMLLDGLLALGLVEKTQGHYRNSAVAEACLVEGAPQDQRHIILHRANGLEAWLGLQRALAEGKGMDMAHRPPEALREFILGMDNIARNSARELLAFVDLTGCRRLLDVGGGPGTYSIVFAQAYPDLRATLFDFPDVVAIAREQAARACLEDRIDFYAGDMTTIPFPAGYDVVFLSNVIHSFDPQTNQRIVRKCYDALARGGQLIVKDFLLDEERNGPPFSLLFALCMFVSTSGGDTYTTHEVSEWTDRAGFLPGRQLDFTPQTRLWIVNKPA